jgi:phosphate transport system substrate-binding protein
MDKHDRAPMWRRAVSGLSAFGTSLGGLVTAVAVVVYVPTASAAHLFPFGPHHKVHPSTSSPGPSVSKCPTGTLTLVGSTAFEPIARVAADAYHKRCPSAHFSYNVKDSASGYTMLVYAAAHDPAEANSMIEMYDSTYTSPTSFLVRSVGVVIFAIVANSADFHESSISVNGANGLENIFIPPGKPGEIAVGRLAGSGSRKALLDNVFNLRDWGSVPVNAKSCPPPSGYTACTEDYTSQALYYVNAIPNAIGYAGYTEFLKNQATYPNVHKVNIGGVAPTATAVQNKSYSFWAVEHLYMTTQRTALAASFLAFLPNYLTSHPQDGFLACPAVPKSLGTDC